MAFSYKVKLQQHALHDLGFDAGPIDGYSGAKTRAAYNAYVASQTNKASVGSKAPTTASGAVKPPSPWGKIKTFGPHGIKGGFTPPTKKVTVPWEMYLYKDGGRVVKTISCHKLIAPALEAFMKELYAILGEEGIRKYGFHLWYGCYAPRKSRGGSSMSDHAWAIANDWNADANGNHTTWVPNKKASNGTYQFSKAIVNLAKKHGFTVGFKSGSSRRDMMHFAYVNRD